MKHPLVELTKLVSNSIPASAWEADPIAKKQGIKSLVQAIKTKAARAGIHKINNILNVKVPIPYQAIIDAAHKVLDTAASYDMDQDTVDAMIDEFLVQIDSVKTKQIPDRVVKASTGMYHNAKEPEHAFNNSLGSFKTANESIVTLLDYARSLYLVANKYHTQIAN
jgi:hypothetical protein